MAAREPRATPEVQGAFEAALKTFIEKIEGSSLLRSPEGRYAASVHLRGLVNFGETVLGCDVRAARRYLADLDGSPPVPPPSAPVM